MILKIFITKINPNIGKKRYWKTYLVNDTPFTNTFTKADALVVELEGICEIGFL